MRKSFTAGLGFLLLASAVWAQPNVGDPAPDFTYTSLDHGSITLSQQRGKVVYLFFLKHA